ncbi:hypothetical protein [Actinokineospora sp. NBRC 105648]|uniref:hypothetical protein n=1 Tax=Actinokineospora sp. NBRC 105648 TaxID=3032206 RepID=UPI00255661C4|nr:hypothetical protein [Actinokineospora sp. NBRC 105648]
MSTDPPFRVVDRPLSVYRRKRFLVPFLSATAVALVGVITLFAGGVVALPFDRVVVIRGKMASKSDFFTDPEVQRILMGYGLQVTVDKAGSRDIANGDLDPYDFVFPSGQPAADLIKDRRTREHRHTKVFKPFFSPVVLATYREYAEALRANGIATPQGPLYYDMPMPAFTAQLGRFAPWRELDPSLRNDNQVTAQTSDVCSSNSAGTYLGMVAFAENGNRIPQDEESARALARKVKPLLTIQGMPGDDMARSYLAPNGQTLAPIAVIYEHQFLAHQIRVKRQTGRVDDRRVLLYPAAQLQAVPELIGLDEAGDRLGELMTTDPDLRARALELGFRVFEGDDPATAGEFSRFLTGAGIPVPTSGIGNTETFLPPLPLLELMINEVGQCPVPTP